MILVWDIPFSDPDENVKTVDVDKNIHIVFVPIIGWRYNHWSHKYGNLNPITPPIYKVKDRLEDSNDYIRSSYWVRDGGECIISSVWTSEVNFWEDLRYW